MTEWKEQACGCKYELEYDRFSQPKTTGRIKRCQRHKEQNQRINNLIRKKG